MVHCFNYILLLPLMASALLLFFGKNLGRRALNLNIEIMINVLLIACFIFYYIEKGHSYEILLWDWFSVGFLSIKLTCFYDSLTIVMLVVVVSVSFFVHIYSLGYMENDPSITRFMAYLSLFTFFMLVLVTSGNFMQLFVGWEGVGICSYLLINFWHTRLQSNKAAIKAIIINRIGDTTLAIGIFLIFNKFGTLNFILLSTLIHDINKYLIDINTIVFFLFIGAVGKSAQVGLHTWLPDAMEGPTPVSALIHAATMVTAGVFLILRCSFLFQEANFILPFITLTGALTTFLGATTALVQNDIKRVIAYSTCSQLGYMVMSCGLTCYNGAIFHLYTHAFFKALLFLTAGNIIHALDNEQDMRKMGGLVNLLPFEYCMYLIGSLALMGFPFLSGYYSKEFILEIAYSKFTFSSHFAFWLGGLSAGCTSFYSLRSLLLIFYGEVNAYRKVLNSSHTTSILMIVPVSTLSLLSIFIGYISKEAFIGLGSPFWGNALSMYPANYYSLINAEFLPFQIKIIPLLFSFLGITFALILYTVIFKNKQVYYLKDYYIFFNRKWYFDTIYDELLVQYLFQTGYTVTYKSIDRGFLESFGPLGLSNNISLYSLIVKKLQTGLVYHYFLYFLLGFISIIIFYFWMFFQIPFSMLILFLIVNKDF